MKRIISRVLFILLAVVMLTAGGAAALFAQTQDVTLTPGAPNSFRGADLALTASYFSADNTLTGLGINIHFDSAKLQFLSFTGKLATDFFAEETIPQNDTANLDGDAATDKFVIITWTSFTGNWPNAGLPIDLVTANFRVLTGAAYGATPVNISFGGTATGYTGNATNAVVAINQLPAPTFVSVIPNFGPVAGGRNVTITGTNFLNGATVTFGGNPATGVTIISDTQITCTTPSQVAAGQVDVVVTNPDAQFATGANAYEYVLAPTVVSLNPINGLNAGGTTVVITGTGFLTGATVTFGETPATNVVIDTATQITCTTPPHAVGPVDVVVANADGQTGTLANGFTYLFPLPTITNISPNKGSENGGTVVTITGTGFQPGATVTFGGTAATNVTINPAGTQITCTTAAKPAGAAVDVVVTNTDGQSATSVGGFQYVTFSIVAPALPAKIKINGTLAFQAVGSISGNYQWTFTGGNPTTATTQNVNWTAPATAQTVTVTVLDPANPALNGSGIVQVFSNVGITNKPTTAPIIQAGASSQAFTVSGGDSANYAWTVQGPVAVAGGTGSTYTFVAPSAGAFAGLYTITVGDTLSTDFFNVKVPMKFTPGNEGYALLEGDPAQTWHLMGAPAGTTFTLTQLDSRSGAVVSGAQYGSFDYTMAGHSPDAVFVWNVPASITTNVAFVGKFTVTAPPSSPLKTAGLDQLTTAVFNIFNVATYTVTVTGNGVPLTASVDVGWPSEWSSLTSTNAQGQATFKLPDTGGVYRYRAMAAGWFTKIVSSSAKAVTIAMEKIGTDTITGTVQDKAAAAINNATVIALQPADVTRLYTTNSDATGAYTITLPVGAAQSGWTVIASKAGYTTVVQSNKAIGAVNFTGTSALQLATLFGAITATPGANNVTLNVTGIFPATLPSPIVNQAAVSVLTGTGTFGAPTQTAASSFTSLYSKDENFTSLIKADTSEDSDVTVGYFASIIYDYIKGDKATARDTVSVDPSGSIQTLTNAGQTIIVELPDGGILGNATLVIKQLPKASANVVTGSPVFVWEVKLLDSLTGQTLAGNLVKRIIITLPIDLTVVRPGSLESGAIAIRKAVDQATLEAGGGDIIPPSQILATDYVGNGLIGSVQFYVTSLSVFGIGAGAAAAPGAGEGGDDCFIATAAYGSKFVAHVETLRKFRDAYLMSNEAGKAFVDAYYRYSPPAANFIAKHDLLRAAVRTALLPLVGMSYMMLQMGFIPTLFGLLGVFALGLGIVGIYRRVRV